ncbi:protein of unknown function (plasmid) [Rhodovastum atsumiense]|nr:protein of unknown function [Rhodovastum atsumiense]
MFKYPEEGKGEGQRPSPRRPRGRDDPHAR